MAEPWTQAFGRYLRTLRERRGLSLQDVGALAQPFAESINKGYLSRCENGKQRIALSKIVPLSRIYGVSGDVILERIDLDMELDRIGGPATEGLGLAQLREASRESTHEGFRWAGYAYMRDSCHFAAHGEVLPEFRDREEQVAVTHVILSTPVLGLGRFRLALHECLAAQATDSLSAPYAPLVLERLAVIYRHLEKLDIARDYADQALALARCPGAGRYLCFAHSARASIAWDGGDLELAASHFLDAYELFKRDGHNVACARTLGNLGEVYFDLGRLGAARRALESADRFTDPTKHRRDRALSRLALGKIDASENRLGMAEKRWREAASIAAVLQDKTLSFKADYQLFGLARRNNDQPVARAIHRRLTRLSRYVPEDTPELRGFERMLEGERTGTMPDVDKAI